MGNYQEISWQFLNLAFTYQGFGPLAFTQPSSGKKLPPTATLNKKWNWKKKKIINFLRFRKTNLENLLFDRREPFWSSPKCFGHGVRPIPRIRPLVGKQRRHIAYRSRIQCHLESSWPRRCGSRLRISLGPSYWRWSFFYRTEASLKTKEMLTCSRLSSKTDFAKTKVPSEGWTRLWSCLQARRSIWSPSFPVENRIIKTQKYLHW